MCFTMEGLSLLAGPLLAAGDALPHGRTTVPVVIVVVVKQRRTRRGAGTLEAAVV